MPATWGFVQVWLDDLNFINNNLASVPAGRFSNSTPAQSLKRYRQQHYDIPYLERAKKLTNFNQI